MKTLKAFLVTLLFFPVLSYGAEDLPLTIKDVIQSSLRHNLDIKVQEFSPKQSVESLEEAKAPFDVNLKFTAGADADNTANTSTFANPTAYTGTYSGSAQASKKFEYGTEATLAYSTSSTNTTSSFVRLKPQYDAGVSLVVTQPLLRDRGVDVNTYQIEIGKNNVEIENLNFRQKLIDVVSESQRRYWELYASRDQLGVKQKSLKLAEKFHDESKLKAKVGAIAPLDVLQAKSEVAYREEEIIIANNTMRNNQDNLLNYIYGDSVLRGAVILREKPRFQREVFDETALISAAFEKRPDYQIAKYNVENSDINIVFAKNQALPTVDLQGTLAYNGLSGNGTATNFNGNFGKANSRMTSGKYYAAGVALTVEFPWGIRRDRAKYRSALYEKEKQVILFTKTEQQIILDVRTAVRNVLAQSKRYQASKLAADLAEETLEAEQKKYKVGISTSYDVLQVQRDYTDASVKHIRAIIDYQLAKVDLYKVTGTTLDRNFIQINDTEVSDTEGLETNDVHVVNAEQPDSSAVAITDVVSDGVVVVNDAGIYPADSHEKRVQPVVKEPVVAVETVSPIAATEPAKVQAELVAPKAAPVVVVVEESDVVETTDIIME